MTLKKLDPSPTARLNEKFPDHPLLKTCQKVFRHYMASMESFDFTSEELFVEAATVLDGIFNDPNSAPDYLNSLWDDLKIRLKQNARSNAPQADLDKVCGVLFYVVAATLSLHWREYYNKILVNQLRTIVERKGVFSDAEEQEQIINNLCAHAGDLDEWINQYDEAEEWLSDEIQNAKAKPAKPREKEGQKEFKPTNVTFTKGAGVLERHLTYVFQYLSNTDRGWIPQDENPDVFLEFFSGNVSMKTIKWMASVGILRDIFKMMIDNSLIVCPDGYGYLEIVSSHFTDKNGEYLTNLKGGYSGKKVKQDIEYIRTIMTSQAIY